MVRDDNAGARVYRALRDDDVVSASVLVRGTSAAEGLVGPVRTALAPLVADSGFVRVTTLREASLGSLTRITRLALVIAGLVLALATVGLYGSIAFVTAQRTREIAIRMAIGAPRAAVLGLVAREGMLVVSGRLAHRPGPDRHRLSVHVRDDLRPLVARSTHDCRRARGVLARHARCQLSARPARGAAGSDEGFARGLTLHGATGSHSSQGAQGSWFYRVSPVLQVRRTRRRTRGTRGTCRTENPENCENPVEPSTAEAVTAAPLQSHPCRLQRRA